MIVFGVVNTARAETYDEPSGETSELTPVEEPSENQEIEEEIAPEQDTIEESNEDTHLEEEENSEDEENLQSDEAERNVIIGDLVIDITVSTLPELLAALGAAPTNASDPFVINIESDITLTGTGAGTGTAQANAVPAGNRAITGGRNIHLISTEDEGINLMVNAVARHFTVGGNATLTIGEGVNLRRVSESTTASAGGGVQVLNTGRLVLDGGRITNNLNLHGNTVATAAVGRGAGVRVLVGGTFDMFSGEISGNRTTADGGSFNNVNRAGGGGIAVDGTFNLHGGTISENWSQGPGGAILMVGTSSIVNIYGGQIIDNWNGTGTTPGGGVGGQGGGAIAMHVGTTLNMYAGRISNNFTGGIGGDGGAIEAAGSTINLFGGTISGNNGRQGGAINNHEGSTLHLLIPETAIDPIGRSVSMAGYAETGVIIESNIARISGGGIVQRGGGGATTGIHMHRGIIRNNQAIGQNTSWDGADFVPGSGGGVYLSTRSFTMHDGIIQGNIAQNTTVTTAPSAATNQGGGGVYILAGTTFTMNDGQIIDNQTGQRADAQAQAGSGGGGVHNRGTFNFNGGEISGNQSGHTATTSGGGGIFTPLSLTIPQNTASTIAILLENNTSATTGGAIAILPTVTTTATVPAFTMTRGTIRNNSATTAGDGIHYAPTLNMNATLATAITTGTGATTQFNISGTAEIENINYAPVVNFGRTGSGTLTIHRAFNLSGNATLSGLINIAPRQRSWNATAATQVASTGTGIHNNTFEFNMTGNPTVLNGLTFAEHPAGANLDLIGSGAGGGARTNHYTVNLLGGTISGGVDFAPHVSGVGGTAGSRINNVTLTLNGTTIAGRTTENGGGIRYQPTLSATGGAAAAGNRTNNSNLNLDAGIINYGIATSNGGGVYHNPHTILPTTGTPGTHNVNTRIRNATITNNKAGDSGGGLFLTRTTTGGGSQNATLNMSEPGSFTRTITSNRAGINGGGLFVSHNLNFTSISNGQINENTAQAQGGGVYIETPPELATATGTFTLTNTSINANTSQLDGASIWVNRMTNIIMTDTTLNHNQTLTGSGGGLHFAPIGNSIHTLTLNGSTINNNTSHLGSGGGLWAQNANIALNDNSTISDNNAAENGGGLFLQRSETTLETGTLTLNGTSAINNNQSETGAGIWISNGAILLSSSGVTIQSNQAEESGGGLNAYNSTIIMNGGSISNNLATYEGGGLFLNNNTNLSLIEGYITNNQASDGGGLYIDDTSYFIGNGGFITNNSAKNDGGGIFTERYENTLIITADAYNNLFLEPDITFTGNSAQFSSNGPANPEIINDHLPETLRGSVIDTHLLNNFDINYPVQDEITFSFYKMDDLMYSDFENANFLAGATFELHRYENGEWTLLETATSDLTGYLNFTSIRPNATYRLFETTPPPGFVRPNGHWVIEVDETGNITIQAEGDLIPAFRIEGQDYFLGNIRDFELPILGGLGRNQRLMLAGLTLIMLSALLTLIARIRRKMQIT